MATTPAADWHDLAASLCRAAKARGGAPVAARELFREAAAAALTEARRAPAAPIPGKTATKRRT